MLEVLTRRYYKIRRLEDVRAFQLEGRQFVTGAFELGGKRLHLISAMGALSELPACLVSVAGLAAAVADPTNLVVDLYLSSGDSSTDPDSVASTLRDTLADVPVLVIGRRVTVTVGDHTGAHMQFTFRPSQGRMQEERVIRGMHPLIGQRFDLWRLKNFTGTPLPATEDTYLFHCVARDNPADERLVAFAEIHDVTPLRDASGQVVAFPAVERKLAACLESIRAGQAERGTARRLDANRIVLYVWPPIDIPLKELSGFARATAPMTVGAGLEEIMMRVRHRTRPDAEPKEVALIFSYRPGAGVGVTVTEPSTEPLAPLDEYTQKVRRSRARGTVYPYEIVPMLTGAGAASPSTTWMRPVGSCRSTGLGGATRRGSSPVWCRRLPPATPRAWCGSPSSVIRPSRWVRLPSRSARGSSPPSTSPRRWRCRSSGSPCPPAP